MGTPVARGLGILALGATLILAPAVRAGAVAGSVLAIPDCTGTYDISATPVPVGGTAQLQEDTSTGALTGTLSISSPIPSPGSVQGTVASNGTVSGNLKIVVLGNAPIPFSGQVTATCSSATLTASVLGINDTITLTRQASPTSTPTPVPPTNTPTSIPPTNTPTAVPTSTPTAVPPTSTPTHTPVPSTSTPTPVPPTHTPTQVPPTHTPTPIPPTSTPTRTPVPPTHTPTSVPPTHTPTPIPPTSTPTRVPPTSTPTSTPTASGPTATATPTLVASAAITVTPAQASPWQRVTVSGVGFAANQRVTVFWNSTTQSLGHIQSDAAGSFKLHFIVPGAIGGSHTLIAQDLTSQQVARTTLVVLPKVFLLHASGTPGAHDGLWVGGFAPREQVVATWAPGSQPLGSATTNSRGGLGLFNGLRFQIPAASAGRYQIVVTGQTSHATASATFTISGCAARGSLRAHCAARGVKTGLRTKHS